MVDSRNIHFRKLLISDLVLMHKWLNLNFVNQWYGKGKYSYEEIIHKYGPRITGQVPTTPYLIQYGDNPIGYIQTYHINDHPDYNKYVQADEHAAGLDLFNRRTGLSPQGIRQRCLDQVFRASRLL